MARTEFPFEFCIEPISSSEEYNKILDGLYKIGVNIDLYHATFCPGFRIVGKNLWCAIRYKSYEDFIKASFNEREMCNIFYRHLYGKELRIYTPNEFLTNLSVNDSIWND